MKSSVQAGARWGSARDEAALQLGPDNRDWRDMLHKSTANATAKVDVPVPDI